MPPDVSTVEIIVKELDSILKNINVNVMNIRLHRISEKQWMCSWSTSIGQYEMPLTYGGPLYYIQTWSSDLFMVRYKINSFVYMLLFSMINNMANNNDTNTVGYLFEALCMYWDQIFLQYMRIVGSRKTDAIVKLNNYVDIISTNRRAFVNKVYFMHFITGSIGNILYNHRQIDQRDDMKDARSGRIR